MNQKLPVDGFKWKNNMLKVNENFLKNYDEGIDKGYILQICMIFVIYHSNQKESRLINVASLYEICMIKITMLFT